MDETLGWLPSVEALATGTVLLALASSPRPLLSEDIGLEERMISVYDRIERRNQRFISFCVLVALSPTYVGGAAWMLRSLSLSLALADLLQCRRRG